MASLPGMASRTITISGLSKTFSVTGWRVGWCVAPPAITAAIRKVHDFLTVGAPHPLQEAAAVALGSDESYYRDLAIAYRARRDRLHRGLVDAGFTPSLPRGAYYILAGFDRFGFADDVAFARHLVEKVGVGAVPGSSFFANPKDGARLIRFCFPKRDATLDAALERLARIARAGRDQLALRGELRREVAAAEQPRDEARMDPHALRQKRARVAAVDDQELETARRSLGGEIGVQQRRGIRRFPAPRPVRDLEDRVDGECAVGQVRGEPRRGGIRLAREQHREQIALRRAQPERARQIADRRIGCERVIVDHVDRLRRRLHHALEIRDLILIAPELAIRPPLPDRALQEAPRAPDVIVDILARQEGECVLRARVHVAPV